MGEEDFNMNEPQILERLNLAAWREQATQSVESSN